MTIPKSQFGSGDITVKRVYFTDEKGSEIEVASTGRNVIAHLQFEAAVDKKAVRLVFLVTNYAGICAIGLRSDNYYDSGTQRLVPPVAAPLRVAGRPLGLGRARCESKAAR